MNCKALDSFFFSSCRNLRVCGKKCDEPSNIKGLGKRSLREICVSFARILRNLRVNSNRAGARRAKTFLIYKETDDSYLSSVISFFRTGINIIILDLTHSHRDFF